MKTDNIRAWEERADIAQKQGQTAVAEAARQLAAAYRRIAESKEPESELLLKANRLRKRIEASEQHRTMSVEHGLGDEAIDVTYEIQELERELVALVQDAQI